MKKFLNMVVVAALASVAFAEDASTDVIASNVLAVRQVPSSVSEIIAPVPFVGVGGEVQTLDSIIPAGNLDVGDTVKVMLDADQFYYNLWTAIPDGTLYPSKRVINSSTTIPAVPTANQQLPRGAALLITHADGTNPVYVMGEYSTTAPTTTIKGNSNTYLANPLTQSVDLNNIAAVKNDLVWLYTGNTYKEYRYNPTAKNGFHWYYLTTTQEVDGNDIMTSDVRNYEALTVPAGAGFAYLRQNGASLTINWEDLVVK